MGKTVNELMELLQKPFKPDEIEWRVGSTNQDKSKGLALAYVTNRAIQQRLDDVFGIFGWKNEFREWKNTSQICGISVKVDNEWITKWDGADDSNMEATKGGLSDAMKRASYQWGIGRYLYKLPSVWCKIKQVGKSYVLAETPSLPKWALPDGYISPVKDDTESDIDKSKKCISEPQAKRLFALAGGDVNIVRDICNKYGYSSSKDISTHDYKEIASEIEFVAKKASGQ